MATAVLTGTKKSQSRYVLAAKVSGKHAPGVTAAVTQRLHPHKRKCHTVTFDNGKEFAEHAAIAVELNADRRPRKVLGVRTPFEIFFGKTVRYTKPPSGVALRS